MPGKLTGNKKKRKAIDRGFAQSNEFANRAISRIDPFAEAGVPAIRRISDITGLNGPEAQASGFNSFRSSPFFTGGETAFNTERDAINEGLANQGLLFSGARLKAVEDAKQRNFQNAFQGFLNSLGGVADTGRSSALAQADILGGQGRNAFNAALAKADTREGFLGTLKRITDVGANIGKAAFGGGFG